MHEGEWIASRLSTFGTTVASVVPRGFASYARVLHPAEAPHHGHGRLVRWAEVAAWSGMPLRADAQFHSIALPPRRPDAPAPWTGQGPRSGSLYPPDALVLAEILRRFSETPERCWFCLWDGFDLRGRPLTAAGEPSPRRDDPPPEAVRLGPRVRLPCRDYLLYEGPADAVVTLQLPGHDQTANLWWPSDHAWAVASEIDLAWSYVGGSAALIDSLLADERVEVLPAGPDDRLTRVEEWVERQAGEAVGRLLATGEAWVETSRGTLHAYLERPTRFREGWLRTVRDGDNGVRGSGGVRLGRGGADDIRGLLISYVSSGVIALVGG